MKRPFKCHLAKTIPSPTHSDELCAVFLAKRSPAVWISTKMNFALVKAVPANVLLPLLLAAAAAAADLLQSVASFFCRLTEL